MDITHSYSMICMLLLLLTVQFWYEASTDDQYKYILKATKHNFQYDQFCLKSLATGLMNSSC